MESSSTLPRDATFFVAKATNMNSLRGCHGNGIWACTPRKTPPQPKDILTEAMDRSPVVLLYSVNNCHGWHGYAEMITKPGTETKHMDINEENTTKKDEEQVANQSEERTSSDEWQRFRVKWMKAYLDENGEKCLPSSKTASLSLPDGTPINNARNFQKVSTEVGYEVCQMIDDHLQELDECRKKKMAEQEARRPAAFFMADEKKEDPKVIWERLTKKVESMGTILLACAFGSQRYNLHTPASDVDMFIVYAAPTKDVLGFNPPQPTIKNRDVDNTCDYTVHEVHRYAELLLAGDPRCVETLFLHPSSIYCSHPTWQQLVHQRNLFLTRACCEKYLRDAEGGKGLRLMQKWEKSGEATTEPMSPKVAKLFYIIIRLLQNASEVSGGEDVQVYREVGSPHRDLLVAVRAGQHTYTQLMAEITRLQKVIKKSLEAHSDQGKEEGSLQTVVEDWTLRLRYEDFHKYMTTTTT